MLTQPSSGKATLLQDAFRWFYSFVLTLIIPFAFINLQIRGAKRSKTYSQRRFERFGFVRRPPKSGGYLLHCVSVGEVVSASCLVKKLMEQEPGVQVTITTTTPTGSARVHDIFGDTVHHFYLPYDLHMAMAGMLKRVQPKAVLITEVELWPNMIHACWKREIPAIVINARMTDRSARRYKKVPILFTPMLNKLRHICAQGKRDFDNYRFLGMPQEKLTLTNNIKFDQASVGTLSQQHKYKGIVRGQRPVLVAGSTHHPEEETLLNAFGQLLSDFPDALLILVPRHPERFSAVEKLLSDTNMNWRKSTDIDELDKTVQVLLLNEMGKLNDAYQVGTVAFVGGSIADRGGHNALEPAAVSLPIMMGPHIYNNPVICEYLQDKGALRIVNNASDIADCVDAWWKAPALAQQAGKSGLNVIQENQGAMTKTLTCISKVLS